MPARIQKAIQDGYTIATKGTLCWSSIPEVTAVPRLRLLYLVLEATFTYYFWTLCLDKNHKLPAYCPWPLEAFQYYGLCTHNPMSEGGDKFLNLDEEQLLVVELARREKRRTADRLLKAKMRDNLRENDPDAYEEWRLSHNEYMRNLDKTEVRRKQYAKEAEAKELALFACKMCGFLGRRQGELDRHLKSQRHLERQKEKDRGITYLFNCALCAFSTNDHNAWAKHLNCKRHKTRSQAAALKASTVHKDK